MELRDRRMATPGAGMLADLGARGEGWEGAPTI